MTDELNKQEINDARHDLDLQVKNSSLELLVYFMFLFSPLSVFHCFKIDEEWIFLLIK